MTIKKSFMRSSIMLITVLCLVFSVFSTHLFADENQKNEETAEYLGMFGFLFKYLQDHYVEEVPAKDLYEGAVRGLFESLEDPHSIYLSDVEMKSLRNTTTGKFGGVGLYISKNDPNGKTPDDDDYHPYVQVVAPIEGSPAYKAGVHTGDYIIKIEGESTIELTIDEVVERLKGVPGTKVTVTVLRNKTIEFDVEITRAIIELPTIKKDMIGSTAYLRIIDWTPYTDDRVREALTFFSQQKLTGIIVDIRGNPGGLLDSVIDVSNLFLNEGIIVSTKSRIETENIIHSANSNVEIPVNIPMIVLIDRGSASASEIFAGAMQDNKRAVIVGNTSYGKGSVQWVRQFGDTGFKLTIAHYHTPLGKKVDKIGIEPDTVIKTEPLNELQVESLKKILEERLIWKFVEDNPEENPSKVSRFIRELKKEGIELEERDIQVLIRDEYNRRMDFPPVYDLEFDRVLKAAVEMFAQGEFN